MLFQPAGPLLLGPPQHPDPLGGLLGLSGHRREGVLGQGDPVAGGTLLAAAQQPPLHLRQCGGSGLLVGLGSLPSLLQVGGPLPSSPKLPRAVGRAGGPQLGQLIALRAQLPGRQPPHIHPQRRVHGDGLAAIAGHHPPEQLLGRQPLPLRVRMGFLAEGLGADGQVQVGPFDAAGDLDVEALHVLLAVQSQQGALFGAALGAHVGARIGQVHPPRLARAHRAIQVPGWQGHRLGGLVLQGAHGHGSPGHIQPGDLGRGAVGDPQPLQRVGAQHHPVTNRERQVADRQPLGPQLAVVGPEPLAGPVELVDLDAAVGVDHRPLVCLVGLPPVAQHRPIPHRHLQVTDGQPLGAQFPVVGP